MPQGPKPGQDLVQRVELWQMHKREATLQDKAAKEEQKIINAAVDEMGERDDKGHIWLELPRPATGYDTKGKPMKVARLQRMRRVSERMDEEVAAEILTEKGLFNELASHWIEVKDPDAAFDVLKAAGLLPSDPHVTSHLPEGTIEAAFFEGKLSKEDMEKIVTKSVSYALYPH